MNPLVDSIRKFYDEVATDQDPLLHSGGNDPTHNHRISRAERFDDRRRIFDVERAIRVTYVATDPMRAVEIEVPSGEISAFGTVLLAKDMRVHLGLPLIQEGTP